MKFPIENRRKQVNWDPEQGRYILAVFFKIGKIILIIIIIIQIQGEKKT